MHALTGTIYQGRTQFQSVGIVESPVFGRMLIIDGDTQSAQLDEFIYHESLVHPAMLLHPIPQEVLILGGGEGATLREVLRHRSISRAIMVEIDQEIVNLSQKYLPEWSAGAFSDRRSEIVFQDAGEYIRNSSQHFDLIISDLTEPFPDTPSSNLYSVDFFYELKNHLSSPGVLVMQASYADIQQFDLHSILYRTAQEVFPIVRSFSARIPSFNAEWGFIIASQELDPLQMQEDEIDRLIQKRINGELRFYDGETHRSLFSIPRYKRKVLEKEIRILRGEEDLMPVESGEVF